MDWRWAVREMVVYTIRPGFLVGTTGRMAMPELLGRFEKDMGLVKEDD